MQEYRTILARRPSGDGTLWSSVAIETDGSVVVHYDAYWPPRPEDAWDGFSRWLRIRPNEIERVYASLTGQPGPVTPEELTDVLVTTYGDRIDAYDRIAELCDKQGLGRDRGTWMESA